tara:strand:+ start:343183 stop:344448 length:1266 start_codon:yes stop_codon:yes gene_type:complete
MGRKVDFNFLQKVRSNKLFFKNFTYLSIVEVINVLAPFIILPYLITTLGKDYYGIVIFSQAVISYFLIIQNYGLNTLAIKEISTSVGDANKLNETVSNVLTLKVLLFFVSFLLLYLTIQFIPFFYEYQLILLFSMWVCIFDVIFPKWYFQGVEKMKYITYVHFVSKVVAILLIFVFINGPEDYIFVPLIYGIGAIISGGISIILIVKQDKIRIIQPKMKGLKLLFKKATTFFISDVSVSVFANSNKVIIGSALGMTELSYYDLADKVIAAFKSVPLNIVRNSIFPRVAKTKNLRIVRNTSFIMGVYALIAVCFIFIFAPFMVRVLGGDDMFPSIDILRLFSLSIITTHISNYYITVGLWSFGYEKIFRNLMIYATLVFLMLILLIWKLDILSIYTLILAPILVDIYLMTHTYLIYKKEKLF